MIAAVEDPLAEAVIKKLLADVRPDISIAQWLPKHGRTYIEKRIRGLNETAASLPVLVVLDLDRPAPCPAELIPKLLGGAPNQHLVMRFAVMETESWVMADRQAFADFLGVPEHRLPETTDSEADAKRFVVNLARRSRRRDIREDLVPAPGSTAAQGPAFNARLTAFVRDEWSAVRAAAASPSLARTMQRIKQAWI